MKIANCPLKIKELALELFVLQSTYHYLITTEFMRAFKEQCGRKKHCFVEKYDCEKCTNWKKTNVDPIREKVKMIRGFLREYLDLNKRTPWTSVTLDEIHNKMLGMSR